MPPINLDSPSKRGWPTWRPTWLQGALPPVATAFFALALWELVVRWREFPEYILPGPLRIAAALRADWTLLWGSLLVTLQITGAALLLATVAGVTLALFFTGSRWVERSFFPFAVALQVTPIVAIAPLILIWVKIPSSPC
jgi:NitT/TauT family transport system permease protein